MPYKFSRCFAMQHPRHNELIDFYKNIIGLKPVESDADYAEFDTAPVRLFADQGSEQALIFELIVPDLEKAQQELVAHGCEVVRWEGKGKTCYIRDPFGFLFNVWEDPGAFASE